MLPDTLLQTSLQIAPAITLIALFARLFPSASPKVILWMWRLVFLRLTVGLFLWPTFKVAVLNPETALPEVSNAIATTPSPPPFPLWECIWGVGVAAFLLLTARESLQARRLVKTAESTSTPLLSGHLQTDLAAPVRVSDTAKVPMVVGFRRPVILIPRDLFDTLSTAEIRMIVAHEAGHIAHRDLLWSRVIWAGRVAFFFHPLVWLAAHGERFAREAAADQFALRAAGGNAHAYGQVLMRVAIGRSPFPSLSPAKLSMSDSYQLIYRRLQTMKHLSHRATPGRLAASGAFCALVLGFLPAINLVPAHAQAPGPDFFEPALVPTDAPAKSPTVAFSGEAQTGSKTRFAGQTVDVQKAPPEKTKLKTKKGIAIVAKTARTVTVKLEPTSVVPLTQIVPDAPKVRAVPALPPGPLAPPKLDQPAPVKAPAAQVGSLAPAAPIAPVVAPVAPATIRISGTATIAPDPSDIHLRAITVNPQIVVEGVQLQPGGGRMVGQIQPTAVTGVQLSGTVRSEAPVQATTVVTGSVRTNVQTRVVTTTRATSDRTAARTFTGTSRAADRKPVKVTGTLKTTSKATSPKKP